MKQIAFYLPSDPLRQARGEGTYSRLLFTSLQKISSQNQIKLLPFSQAPPNQADLVHYTYFDLFRHTLPLIKSKPIIVSILDVIPLEFPDHYPPGLRGSINLFLQRFALQNVSHIITISNYSKRQINKHLHLSDEKITVTPLAANPAFGHISQAKILKSAKSRHHLPDQFVLYVGDINWNKNLERLTQACVDANLHLVIVGRTATDRSLNLDHPELSHFKVWLDLYATHPLVHRLGFVPTSDLVAIYNLASVYCQPSLSEGFGLPILDALACGIPVASSNRSSLPEVAGPAALYFDPENVAEIRTALEKIVSEKDLARDLKHKGKLQAKKFNWAKTARQTVDVYLKYL